MDENQRLTQQGNRSVYAEGNAYITYANDHRVPRALTVPPFLPEVFLGRGEDLLHIRDRLFSGGSNLLLLVNGVGGIGKTSIAAKYYHQYASEYQHTAWILSEPNIVEAMLRLAEPLELRFDERQGSMQRLELLLAALANLEKPCLLVIDNANELTDLEANYQRLRCCGNFHLLLTTRLTHFAYAESYAIDILTESEALALFEKYYRKLDETERELFLRIREAVGGNTLVLELLAKNLAAHNNPLRQLYTLDQLLADLQQRGVLGLSQSKAVATDYRSQGAMRKEAPETIIAAMYDLGGLSREEIALLSVLAVLPPESIYFAELETLLPEAPSLADNLLSLAQKGWIECNENDETAFKCSPVVQEVVRRKNSNLLAECTVLIKVLI